MLECCDAIRFVFHSFITLCAIYGMMALINLEQTIIR